MVRTTAPLLLRLAIVLGGTPQPVIAKPDGTPGTEYPVGFVSFRGPSTNAGLIKVGRKDQTGAFQYMTLEKGGAPVVWAIERDLNGNVDLSSLWIDGATADVCEITAFNCRR